MSDWPPVPEALRERLDGVDQIGGKGVGEVFYGSHLRADCPDCGNELLLRRVYYTADGDGPIAQQSRDEIAHEYLCADSEDHDDQHRWVVDVEESTTWYRDGTGDA